MRYLTTVCRVERCQRIGPTVTLQTVPERTDGKCFRHDPVSRSRPRSRRIELNYTRIFEDREGESHFQDVDVEVAPVDFAPPAPPLNLSEPLSAERIILADVPVGWVGDWHPTPRCQFCFVLSGELEVEVSDGEVRRIGPGAVVLLEDATGKGHLTRALGETEARVAFVQLPGSSVQ